MSEGISALPIKPVLHDGNSAALKATTALAMLDWLGIKRSYSRPRLRDDNAFAESLFRTTKYRPQFPVKGIADLESACVWAAASVRWHNHEHRHRGIRYVTSAQRHAVEDHPILAARNALYPRSRQPNPARWSRHMRDWSVPGPVTLNP